MRKRWLLVPVVVLAAIQGSVASAEPVHPLDPLAHPVWSTQAHGSLTDLRPFGRMVDGADVVGVGEATHNSREFFTLKHRLFRYLVERKGFTAYSLEVGWSSGLRIDDYVRHGRGDLGQLMRTEFLDIAPAVHTALAESYDVVIHLHEVHRAHPL